MKTFNKSQAVFIFAVMLVAAWFAGSFIFFVLYFSQIKNLKPLKAVFRSIDAYRMDIFTDSLTLSVVTTDIRVLAFVARDYRWYKRQENHTLCGSSIQCDGSRNKGW